MSKITYTDKVALNVNPNIADINKVNDTDMNMIKEVVNANETKILLAVSDTAPAECSLGDMYFDTTDNLIYTAIGINTWGSTGETPTENTIYVVIDTQTSYIYDGTTLISVGGGSGGIVVAPDTPTEDTILYIESTDLDGQFIEVNDIYSTDEIKTNKVWIDGKPIYRKVFTGNWDGTTDKIISLGTNDILHNVYGFCSDGTYKRPLNSNWSQVQALSMIFTNNEILITQSGSVQPLTYVNYMVVAEYTKGGNS